MRNKKYLIGQIACFGDCLLATTLAKQLKHDEPGCHVTWAVAAKYRSVLDHNPDIDEIWELPIYTRNISREDWYGFENEAVARKAAGVYDEILYTQIFNRYVHIFYTTLRRTVYNIFGRPVTVDRAPVIKLTQQEIDNVARFAKENRLDTYKNVVLFECAPTSDQSKLNVPFASKIATDIARQNPDICFILTTSDKLDIDSRQIADASVLSFRENAELTRYCTLLIGCSSGITWLSTSDYCKKLPMIQLLNERSAIFAGVNFDFELNGVDNSHIVEMVDYDEEKVLQCVNTFIEKGVSECRQQFNQPYKPNKYSLQALAKSLVDGGISIRSAWQFMRNYIDDNKTLKNRIKLNKLAFFLRVCYWKLHHTKNNQIRSFARKIKPLRQVYQHVKA